MQSTITWPVLSGCQVTSYITGTIYVPEHNFWVALAWGCLLWEPLYFIGYICPGICWLVPVETNSSVWLSSYADATPLSWEVQIVSSQNCLERYSKAIRVSMNQGTAIEIGLHLNQTSTAGNYEDLFLHSCVEVHSQTERNKLQLLWGSVP